MAGPRPVGHSLCGWTWASEDTAGDQSLLLKPSGVLTHRMGRCSCRDRRAPGSCPHGLRARSPQASHARRLLRPSPGWWSSSSEGLSGRPAPCGPPHAPRPGTPTEPSLLSASPGASAASGPLGAAARLLGLGAPSTPCPGPRHSASARRGPEGGLRELERDVRWQRFVLAAPVLLGTGSEPASGINSEVFIQLAGARNWSVSTLENVTYFYLKKKKSINHLQGCRQQLHG